MESASDVATNNASIRNSEDWFESTDKPSRDVLYQLAKDNTPESMEALRDLAERYNVNNFDDPDNMIELADKIARAVENPESVDGGL